MSLPDGLIAHEGTCRGYALRAGDAAVLVDPGDLGILARLGELSVARATDALLTHHHRDGLQGLGGPAAAGLRVWAPETERDLVARSDEHWQARDVDNTYDPREDRFTALGSIPVHGLLRDHERLRFADLELEVLPAPGHTPGSVALLAELAGRRVAFVGDLMRSPGKLWSLAATQWTYNGGEGIAMTIVSLLDLKDRRPDLLLPAHGDPIEDPDSAIDLTVERLLALLQGVRRTNPRLLSFRERPFDALSPHLLMNRTSVATSYVLLSDGGRALVIDFGYDLHVGLAAGSDRASRRPSLASLPSLKRDFGVRSVDVAIPTHAHDDHVAGLNLLRRVEGTRVWASRQVAEVLEHPRDWDLPCRWYDPVAVDRVLETGVPFRWEEHDLTLHPFPGHVFNAVAIEIAVDGRKVLAIGDQYADGDGLNYVYANGLAPEDYVRSAELVARLKPDLLLTGHWGARTLEPGEPQRLLERGLELERLHRELLPLDEHDPGRLGRAARLRPYEAELPPGEPLEVEVLVRNPAVEPGEARVCLAAPDGWAVEPAERRLPLGAREEATVGFRVTPAPHPVRRARIAADLSVGAHRYGQVAEALITVLEVPRGL